MNIVVCLKQVPGTANVRIDPVTNTLIREGIENIINPFDAYALEAGVRLRELHGGKVTALSMGPPQAKAMLRGAISLGADAAVLLSDKAFAGADTWATAYTLAAAVKKLEAIDLVICGRQTVDGDTGQVGPELAELLDWPFTAYVNKTEFATEGEMHFERMVEGGHETVAVNLPAVITVTKEINTPRLPSLRGLARSKSAEITVWGAESLGADMARVGLAGSATQVVKIFFPKREVSGEMLTGTPDEQVSALISKLREAELL